MPVIHHNLCPNKDVVLSPHMFLYEFSYLVSIMNLVFYNNDEAQSVFIIWNYYTDKLWKERIAYLLGIEFNSSSVWRVDELLIVQCKQNVWNDENVKEKRIKI